MSAVESIARSAVSRTAEALLVRAREQLPRDVSVARTDDGIVVTGRNLNARALTDARLRGIGR